MKMAQSFLLTDEPWIRVMEPGCRFKEVSLRDALLNAHQYSALAGESPAQDAAMLRLLIAVAYTVFYRTDENGQPAVLRDAEDALDRWAEQSFMGSLIGKQILTRSPKIPRIPLTPTTRRECLTPCGPILNRMQLPRSNIYSGICLQRPSR